MKARGWFLLQTGDGWQIGRMVAAQAVLDEQTVASSSTSPEDAAQEISQHLQSLGYSGEQLLIGLSTNHCLPGNIKLGATNKGREPKALKFALEEQFPPDAEDVVADFIFCEDDVLGIATPFKELNRLVTAMEQRGVMVQSISPTSLLAVQQALLGGDARSADAIVWGWGKQIEVFLLDKGRLRNWIAIEYSPENVLRVLRYLVLAGQRQMKLASFNLPSSLLDALPLVDELELVGSTPDKSLPLEAIAFAQRVLTGERAPWIELRRDELSPTDSFRAIRRSLSFATIAAIVLLISLSAAFLTRAARYDLLARQSLERQTESFQRVFPGRSVPTGIRSRLESEKAKLAGLTGDQAEIPAVESALTILHGFLTSLPDQLTFRVLELRVEQQGRIHLEGEVRKHGDAGEIVAAVRAAGFQADNPTTTQLADVVSYRFDANYALPSE